MLTPLSRTNAILPRLSAAGRHIAGLVLALGLSGFAQAADTPAPMQACRADAQKFCAGTRPGGGRLATCLQAHKADLSPACQSGVDTLKSCTDEVHQLCGDAGPGALRTCLKTKATQLTPACRHTEG